MGTFALLCLMAVMSQTYADTLPNYEVEVYFVVEKRLVDEYAAEAGDVSTGRTNLRADIEYFLTEVNQMYATASSYGLNIQVRQRKLDILDTNIFPDTVERYAGMETFWTWLQDQNAYATINYDAAVLWTGSDIRSETSNTNAGFATYEGICNEYKGYALALVEFDRTYHTAVVTAHELAHILGAHHDTQAKGYVMAPTTSQSSENRWKMSQESVNSIRDHIDTLKENCLLTTNPSSSIPDGPVTGQLADPNTICARKFNNSSSRMCMYDWTYRGKPVQGDNVCRYLRCNLPETPGNCPPVMSSDGLICAHGKRCNDGKCQPDSSPEAAAVDPTCPFGDQEYVKFNLYYRGTFQGTCSECLAQKGKAACYFRDVASACCKSCKEVSNGIEGCEYGDSSTSCVTYRRKENICPQHGNGKCCEFCRGWNGKRSASKRSNDLFIENQLLSEEETNLKARELEPESESPEYID